MSKRTVCLLLAAALLSTIASAQTSTADEQIAAQFMPPAFAAFAAANTYLSDHRTTSILPVDLEHTGRADFLAVAYGNGHIAYLRVIRRASVPALAGESAPALNCDSTPSVSAVDLDGDGKPELSLQCRAGNAGHQFYSFFNWSAGALTALNPPSQRRPNAWEPIMEANFVDVDGTGAFTVLAPSCPFTVDDAGAVDQCWAVYRLVNGKLTKSADGEPRVFERFNRSNGTPSAEARKFSATPGLYTLTVINGERGENMATAGTIKLNGTALVPPGLFSKNARTVSRDVTLAAQNVLEVELRSAPETFIHIVVSPKR
jgi:hypothetical protein